MKKFTAFFTIVILVIGIPILSSCSDASDVIVITDDWFITQLNEISNERDYYMGNTIQIEGMFNPMDLEWLDFTVYFVERYFFGCCGEERLGFQVYFDDEQQLPESDEWVRVIGVLEECEATPIGIRLRVLEFQTIPPGQAWVTN